MKTKTTKHSLGPYNYNTEVVKGQGHRYVWDNPPQPGTLLLRNPGTPQEVIVTLDQVYRAGMLEVTDASGYQCAVSPELLAVYEGD